MSDDKHTQKGRLAFSVFCMSCFGICCQAVKEARDSVFIHDLMVFLWPKFNGIFNKYPSFVLFKRCLLMLKC